MQKIVVLSGAGVSAESGLKTFRDSDGLWEGYRPEEVATPEAWEADPARVLRFYNERRVQVKAAQPNAAHLGLAKLEARYEVQIITQNVDDLHERAGSTKVLHLHGEILKARSTYDDAIYPIAGDLLNLGDCCPRGAQLRPHVVWFGEAVPAMEEAIPLMIAADIVFVVGTSLVVYPAAGLVAYAPRPALKFVIDPRIPDHVRALPHVRCIGLPAGEGVAQAIAELDGHQ